MEENTLINMKPLVPRLNYIYTFSEAITALTGIFKSNIDVSPLYGLFKNDNIYFVNHARTGIRMALNSLNLPQGAYVGVQVYNCHTVFNAIYQAGYKPVFIDINQQFQIDIEDLESKKSKIDALIVTHLFGIPAEMDKILKTVKGLPVIEDCAHAFLSKYRGKLLGTYGDLGVFSIGKAKFPSIGQGGYVVVNKNDYICFFKKELDGLKNNSLFEEFKTIIYSMIMHFLHIPFIYGFLTLPLLKKIDKKNNLSGKFSFQEKRILKANKYLFLRKINSYQNLKKKQQNNAKKLINKYFSLASVQNIYTNPDYDCNYFMLPLIVDNDKNQIINEFYSKNREVGTHFNQSIIWAKSFGYFSSDCKKAEGLLGKIITLPTYR